MIEVSLPGFHSSKETFVGGVTINVLSTVRTDVHVCVEVKESTLEWMAHAINIDWDVEKTPWAKKKRKKDESDAFADMDLPELSQSSCKYFKRSRNMLVVAGAYRQGNGKWKYHTRSIGQHVRMMSSSRLLEHVRAVEHRAAEGHSGCPRYEKLEQQLDFVG